MTGRTVHRLGWLTLAMVLAGLVLAFASHGHRPARRVAGMLVQGSCCGC